ncbi:MAG: hypothetical protein K6F84_04560 [Lachnospiraceae bacterium]|nr:hypothetical protein [Lachnospiraceae bacterium]
MADNSNDKVLYPENTSVCAEGFLFYKEEDAAAFETEQARIRMLEKKIDYSKPESVLRVYDRLIDEKIFTTVAGLIFIKKLRDFLVKNKAIDEAKIKPIPEYLTYSARDIAPRRPVRRVEAIKPKPSAALPCSVILNILLVLAIMVMFYVTLKSEQPNIFNYETALVNKYSEWDKELSEKEAMLREKELELKKITVISEQNENEEQ